MPTFLPNILSISWLCFIFASLSFSYSHKYSSSSESLSELELRSFRAAAIACMPCNAACSSCLLLWNSRGNNLAAVISECAGFKVWTLSEDEEVFVEMVQAKGRWERIQETLSCLDGFSSTGLHSLQLCTRLFSLWSQRRGVVFSPSLQLHIRCSRRLASCHQG